MATISDMPDSVLRRILAFASARDFCEEGLGAIDVVRTTPLENIVKRVSIRWRSAIEDEYITFRNFQRRARYLGKPIMPILI